ALNSASSQGMHNATLESRFAEWFDQQVGLQSNGLYRGAVYPMVLKSRFSHQFFESRSWSLGTIAVNANVYYNVPLILDLEQGLIIVKHPDLSRRDGIVLDQSKVSWFSLRDHTFSKLKVQNQTGFFDVLFQGSHFDFVVKRRKQMRAEVGGISYTPVNSYGLYHEGKLITLKSKKDLDAITGDSKTWSKEITRSAGKKFKLNDETALLAFLKELDERLENE
ncbi:MAG: hypothetical protein KI790_12345, partial [Cyclobacteriaceae bacterium]|nr:hypothetical protein [Cyclobacteriaceae bacterium HetDA_MAG_MS6]